MDRVQFLTKSITTKEQLLELDSFAEYAETTKNDIYFQFIRECFSLNTKVENGHTMAWFMESKNNDLLLEVLKTADIDRAILNVEGE